MDEQRVTPAEQPPRHVTIRDKRRVLHDTPGAPSDVAAVSAPLGGTGSGAGVRPASPPPGQNGAEGAGQSGPSAAGIAAELDAARSEASGYLEDLQRLKAEFDNYRKRMVKEQSGLVERAAAGLVMRLLPVLDNFDLAVASAEDSRDFERMLRGIEMVFGELKEVLASEGLERIAARGNTFDPNYHEAALEVPGEGDEAYVADELRSGYTFKGRVVRPAMVKVARRN